MSQWLARDPNEVYRPFDSNTCGNSASNNNNNNLTKTCMKSGAGTETSTSNNITQMMNNSTAHG